MAVSETVLLLGNSVRYLAQSAQGAGYAVTAVDAFNDSDTREASRRYARAGDHVGTTVDAALRALQAEPSSPWAYGAGFEAEPAVLSRLCRRFPRLLGNDPKVLQLLAQTERFFGLLDELDIAYPEIVTRMPADPTGWLHKAAGRAGGTEVCLARQVSAATPSGYFQRRVKGVVCSLLFAADGSRVQELGFNRVTARYPAAGDFRFSTVIAGYEPTAQQATQMTDAATRLTRALGLRGVNGLDFVLQADEALLLDVNARPPASLELYESSLPAGGFAVHQAACLGRLPTRPTAVRIHGSRVIYARDDACPGTVDWPDWVSDRPAPGVSLTAEMPVCTVHAEGRSPEAVAVTLRQRADIVVDLLNRASREAA